jgi:non-homologous end joining protein Ku
VAPRAYWKGYLKLSLVSCPVALFPASSEREIADEKIPKDMLELASHIVETREVVLLLCIPCCVLIASGLIALGCCR